MARIVLPTPDALALRYRRQNPNVQTDGMSHYTMKDLATGMALAEKVSTEVVFPAVNAGHKALVRDPNQRAAMEAARARIGAAQLPAQNEAMGADPDVVDEDSAIATEPAQGGSDYANVLGSPVLMRRGVPTVAMAQAPMQAPQQAPQQAPMERDRPGDMAGGTVSVPGASVELPAVPQQELPPVREIPQQPQQSATARIPQAAEIDVNPQAVMSMNELSTLAQAARATNDPVQMARVAQIIDAQPMEDAEPRGWFDFFTGNHKRDAKEALKAKLGLGSGSSSANDPLKRMELERKILDSEAMRPGRQADSEAKQVAAAGAERKAAQEERGRDLSNRIAELDALLKQGNVPKAQAEAIRADIKARWTEREIKAAILAQKASASKNFAQAKTENQLRDDRQENVQANTRGAYVRADDMQVTRPLRVENLEQDVAAKVARTRTDDATRAGKVRELKTRSDMQTRMPADSVGAGSRTDLTIDDKIARAEADIAGNLQWLSANPEATTPAEQRAEMRRLARATGDEEAASAMLKANIQERKKRAAEIADRKQYIESLKRTKPTVASTSTHSSGTKPRTP